LKPFGGGKMKKQFTFLALFSTLALVSNAVIFGLSVPASAQGKPIELNYAIWVPPVHVYTKQVAEPWAAEVAKQTNGRVKINIFAGSALGKAPDHYDLAVRGAADIVCFNPGFTPGRFPLTSVIELPFMTHHSTPSSLAAWELYTITPDIQAEFSQVKMFGLGQTDPAQLFTVKKPVRSLADLKGMTIRVPDERTGEAAKRLGATPVFMPMTDLYQALERGTIDGCMVAIEACQSFRVHEVTKYCTMIDISSITMGTAWNINSWNNLPQDIQKLLGGGELGPSYMPIHYGPAFEKLTKRGLELMKQAKVETITLSPDELARWKKLTMPVWDMWVKSMEAQGKPARKILDDTIRLEDKYLTEYLKKAK
jgi:TRAP-type C4-dicarboxylate transport system substrate-binding protein